jgi:tetratricopeptide (TPR) repeat protein
MTPTRSDQPVRAWVDSLTLPTYDVPAPDPNPMFFETRNIQGSSGRIYPNPITDQLSSYKEDRPHKVIYLENEYIQMMMMPGLGGRIFAGRDKTNGYDFFYRHRAIKPQLIGTFGAWISGGVEFNWPQHHRPSTFMPVDFTIEDEEDGSVTVWLSEHDPLYRTKGMVGICLYPGKAFVETKVRLYNRTPFPQAFLWWENAGVHIHEDYQIFFPPDVHSTVYHVKRPVVEFPIATGEYGAMTFEKTDLRWYKNFPVPSSFFANQSNYDFFGGYDHRKDAGVVHVADRHISPGKKFFTWGNGPFGRQWQHNLSDYNDPYLELMAGVYTDNQPDFSWIQPYETKTFSQIWFPIQKIGEAKNANRFAAISLEVKPSEGGLKARVGAYAVETFTGAHVTLSAGEQKLLSHKVDLKPGSAFVKEVDLPTGLSQEKLRLSVTRADGVELIHYGPADDEGYPMPDPYVAPPRPDEAKNNEELYLVGLHLDQYKHPVWFPEPYWEEALRRDPQDIRSNNALGLACLRRGMLAKAEGYFRTAVKRLTWRNENPADGEPHYNLGLTLFYQGRLEEACKALYKATWCYAWQSAGFYALAQIDCLRKDYPTALAHLDQSLLTNAHSLKARDLKAALLRHLDRPAEAVTLARQTVLLDALDHWAHNELALALRQAGKIRLASAECQEALALLRGDVQTVLDIAFDYAGAGLWEEASEFLKPLAAIKRGKVTGYPMVYYTLGFFAQKSGDEEAAWSWYQRGAQASYDYCFPARLEELMVLQAVVRANPQDARAHYYLGNLLYDKKQYDEAMAHWEISTRYEPSLAIPWRNLGLGTYNRFHDIEKAISYYQKALAANPKDPRIFYELDQLQKRACASPESRLKNFQKHHDLAFKRGDMVVEMASLYNRLGQPEKALDIFTSSEFHLWEGGEGLVLEQKGTAYWLMGLKALDAGDPQRALDQFNLGLALPDAWGELALRKPLSYSAGLAHEALGDAEGARKMFENAAQPPRWTSPAIYYQALALKKLDKPQEAEARLAELLETATRQAGEMVKVDYFYPQVPSVTFEDDLQKPNDIYSSYLAGLAYLGLGQVEEAKRKLKEALAEDPSQIGAYMEYSKL